MKRWEVMWNMVGVRSGEIIKRWEVGRRKVGVRNKEVIKRKEVIRVSEVVRDICRFLKILLWN